MDEFTVVGAGGKPKPGHPSPSPRSPAAASVVTDGEGKRYRTPFEWLAAYDPSSLASRWHKSLGGKFYCAFCNGKEKHHPIKCPLLGELGLKLIDSVAAIVGLLQVLPPWRTRRVVLRLSCLQQLHQWRSSPCRRRLWALHLPWLDSRSRWRRVMRVPRIAFAGMGMMTGWILNLMGLIPCTHRLLSILSVPLLPLPLHLRRPVLGCPCPCRMRTLRRTISFSLRDLCLLCTRLSLPRSLWRDFN